MRGRISPVFGLLALPLLFLLRYGNQFLYLSGAEFSDLTVSHLPNALFFRRSLSEWGQIPLWSNTILSGYPFVANPLSGLFYPPGWLALLWPEAWTFNLLAGLHLVWGGVGMALFLKKQGLRAMPGMFGGLAFAFMPKLLAHYGAGHVTLLYAVAWTPWLLYAIRNPLHFPYLSSFILALIFFADVRWAAFAGVLGGVYVFGEKESAFIRVHPRPVFFMSAQLLLAAALSAPLALPLLEYVRLSTRATLGAEDVLAFSLPPARLLGLLFPEMGGNPEWIVYPGMATFTLALLGLFWPEVRQKTRFWWGVWLVSVIYSLGANLPGLSLLAGIPGVSLLRVPPRAMFLGGIALAVLAAYAFDHLLAGVLAADRRRAMRVLVILLGGTAMLAVGVGFITGETPLNFIWGSVMVGFVMFGVRRVMESSRPAPVWTGFFLVGIGLLDWGGVAARSLVPHPVQDIYSEKTDVAEFLTAHPGLFRVYSPSYSLPQYTAARFGLELADGVDPMQLQSYVTFMEDATGVPQMGYSVTMPPFADDIAASNAGYQPDTMLLASLNVQYVVSAFDLQADGLVLLEKFGETRVYENTLALSRAWVQGRSSSDPLNAMKSENVHWTPNRVEVKAEGPGLLVLSEIAYPGWRVELDGQPADLILVDGLLRGVNLPPGTHPVVFSFHPTSFYVGLGLFGIAILGIVIRYFTKRKK